MKRSSQYKMKEARRESWESERSVDVAVIYYILVDFVVAEYLAYAFELKLVKVLHNLLWYMVKSASDNAIISIDS